MSKLTRRALISGATTAAASLSQLSRAHPQVAGLGAADRDALRAIGAAFMQRYGAPALSVAIAQDDRLVYVDAYGTADRAAGTPATPAHRFRIASVSKPFTSVTLFRLVEAGRVRLSDRVFGPGGILDADFGPRYGKWVTDVTVEHLLTHTCGGWQNDGTDPMFSHPEMNHHQLIAWAIDALPLAHEPGSHYAYSNFGYCILGRVIEKLTRQPYESAVKSLALRPCGVAHMQIAGNTLADRAADEVVYVGQGGEDPYDMQVARMDSHGGWIATPTDLVRFATRVDGFPHRADILSESTLRTMTTATTANPNYAKGWAVNPSNNWWHNGSLPGTISIMVRTGSGFCWAALTNTRKPGSDIDGALDRMMWDMVGAVKVWPDVDLF